METITDDVAAIIDGSSVPRKALLLFADNQYRGLDEDTVADAEDAYLGSAWSIAAWAEEFTNDTGMLDGIPEDLRYYFDYDKWARDGFMGGDIFMVEETDGYKHFFHS